MIHLLFLITTLTLALLGQYVILGSLKTLESWKLRRGLEFLGLALPLSVLSLFAFSMLPTAVETFSAQFNNYQPPVHHSVSLADNEEEALITLISFGLLVLPVVFSLLFSGVRIMILYGYTYKRTWQSPDPLSQLLTKPVPLEFCKPTDGGEAYNNSIAHFLSLNQPQLRLWYSKSLFAFNLPSLGLFSPPLIIISTAMVQKFNQAELQAVLWHEVGHLIRRDCWLTWLAKWWRDAFFYLPTGARLVRMMQAEQELACDEQVVKCGGVPMALNLAQALLRVWEETTKMATLGKSLALSDKPNFDTTGLTLEDTTKEASLDLTEQRVSRLIEFGSLTKAKQADHFAKEESSWGGKLKVGGFITAGFTLWLLVLEAIHLLMLPMGCVLIF